MFDFGCDGRSINITLAISCEDFSFSFGKNLLQCKRNSFGAGWIEIDFLKAKIFGFIGKDLMRSIKCKDHFWSTKVNRIYFEYNNTVNATTNNNRKERGSKWFTMKMYSMTQSINFKLACCSVRFWFDSPESYTAINLLNQSTAQQNTEQEREIERLRYSDFVLFDQ